MDLLVGRQLEATAIGLSGVTGTRSLSVDSHHALWVEFDGDDLEARMRLLDALDTAQLPTGSEPPWMTTGGGARRPRLWIVLSGDSTTAHKTDAASDLRRTVMGIGGVDRVDVLGGARPRVAIRVDPARASAYGATADDIVDAVYAATATGTVEALAATPVGGRAAQLTLVEDVATVEHGPGRRDSLVSSRGGDAVLLEVVATPDADPASFEQSVTETVEHSLPTLAHDLDVVIASPDAADLVVDVTGPMELESLARIAALLSELADEFGADTNIAQAGVPHHLDVPQTLDGHAARLHLGWSDGAPDGARERLQAACDGHPGASCWVHSPLSETTTVIVTADDEAALEVVAEVAATAAEVAGVLSAHHVEPMNEPVVKVLPDRDRLARLGIDPADVTRTVRGATLGLPAGRLVDGARIVPVVVYWGEVERNDPRALADLEVFGSRVGAPIPLDQICTIELDSAPRSIQRVNGLWARTVTVEIPSRGAGRVRKRIEAAVREVALPGGAAVTFE
jgi:multidrug efflux pump subunit AcrB